MTFNALLEDAGLDPGTVKMARHQDTGKRVKVIPYSVWRSDKGAYLTYNQVQKREKFSKADFIAAFVVTPAKETLFTSIFRNNGVGEVPEDTYCPVIFQNRHGTASVFYDLEKLDLLAEYQG